MATPLPSVAPGTYRVVVRSQEEAVAVIRERFGAAARVLSVRARPMSGLARFFSRPRLEIVVAVDEAKPAGSHRLELASVEPAEPLPAGDAGPVASPARPATRDLPRAADLSALLRRSGVSEPVLERLQAERNWPELNRLPLHRALAETSRLLMAQVDPRGDPPVLTRAVFLGTAGVGRTTVLCKLLAQEVFRRGRLGHVVAVEFDRPNPLGPLPVFSEALGIPLAHYPCATAPGLPGGFVFFDVPALAPGGREEANTALREFLDREAIAQRVLVLHAAYDRAALRAAHAAGRALGATHLVFTHLDEVPQWGKLWDYLFDESLQPLLLATGPSLTGDWEADVTGAIARRTLPAE